MQTRDQKYAAKIYEQVSALPENDHQKYGTMSHKLPILIRTAGLVQALAFVEARGEEAQKKLLDHIAIVVGVDDRANLLRQSRTAALSDYMNLTQQVLTALLWYKRFAQSILKVDASDAGTETGGQ
ncbi:MAG TPA: type III-B CRISPR module-associated protein Cmr5 [Anaerolineae bacterium]|nr:type III-B CRISPR module-associated protein Cmr5 [Anaerolineae bacterium]